MVDRDKDGCKFNVGSIDSFVFCVVIMYDPVNSEHLVTLLTMVVGLCCASCWWGAPVWRPPPPLSRHCNHHRHHHHFIIKIISSSSSLSSWPSPSAWPWPRWPTASPAQSPRRGRLSWRRINQAFVHRLHLLPRILFKERNCWVFLVFFWRLPFLDKDLGVYNCSVVWKSKCSPTVQ